jgi:SlyX protein
VSRSAIEDRLIALESRIAHHERMAEELSDVMAAQAGTIDQLQRRLRQVTDKLLELMAERDHSPQDDRPPPHY